MLRNNRNKPLQASKYRAVNDDGARLCFARVGSVLGGAILELKAFRELEVELDRRALERAAQGVTDLDVDFGAVERAIAGVELPFSGVVRVEGFLQLL